MVLALAAGPERKNRPAGKARWAVGLSVEVKRMVEAVRPRGEPTVDLLGLGPLGPPRRQLRLAATKSPLEVDRRRAGRGQEAPHLPEPVFELLDARAPADPEGEPVGGRDADRGRPPDRQAADRLGHFLRLTAGEPDLLAGQARLVEEVEHTVLVAHRREQRLLEGAVRSRVPTHHR